eukprot:1780561-Prymnesium_polylepis.2
MAQLQVHPKAHCFSGFGGKCLRLARPRQGVEVDEHTAARVKIVERSNIDEQSCGGSEVPGTAQPKGFRQAATSADPGATAARGG